MTFGMQILLGSAYLGICCLAHAAVIAAWSTWLRLKWSFYGMAGTVALIWLSLLVLVVSHTSHVWLWAWALTRADALPDRETALYFALVSYTTVGYGDVTLGEGMRIFGAMSSVAGLFAFGLSTAFLVALMGRVMGRNAL